MFGRRTLYYGMVAGVLVAGCGPNREVRQSPLVGAWKSAVQFKTGAFTSIQNLEFMYVFNAGGTMTESSNYDGAPPVPPAYGIWRQVAPGEFEVRYEFYSTTPSAPEAFKTGAGWLPSGHGVLTERIRMSADSRSFTSSIRYQGFGMHNEPVEGSGEGEGHAARMEF